MPSENSNQRLFKVLQRVIIDGMELLFGAMKCSENGDDGWKKRTWIQCPPKTYAKI